MPANPWKALHPDVRKRFGTAKKLAKGADALVMDLEALAQAADVLGYPRPVTETLRVLRDDVLVVRQHLDLHAT